MKPNLIQRVAKLVPYPSKNSTVPALAFAYHFEPSVEQGLELGSLFVAIEVMAKEALASQVVDLVIKTIGEHYYNQKFNDEVSIRFEKTVDTLNKQLAELLESHHGGAISNIHAVFAILNDTKLYLTKTGKAHAILYRGAKTTEISDGLEEGSTNHKSFYNIAEGELQSGDKLLFATPALLFQFPKQELHDLITDNSPSTCVNKFSTNLGNDETASRSAAVVVELASLENAAERPMDDNEGDATIGKPRTRIDDLRDSAQPVAKRIISTSSDKLTQAGGWIKASLLSSLKAHLKNGWHSLWVNHINPNPKRAIAITVGSLLIITVLIMSFFNSGYSYKALLTSYKETTALTDTAEAKFTLGQNQPSRAALTAAEKKLADISKQYPLPTIKRAITLDKDLRAQSNILPDQLLLRHNTLEDKLAGITRQTSSSVVDFATIKSFTPSPLAQLDDRLYLVDTSTGSLEQINPSAKTTVSVGKDTALRNAVSLTTSSDGSTLFILTKSSGVFLYRPGGSLSPVQLSGGSWSTGQAVSSYIGNLYILSPENNQIYRHSKTSIGFSASSSYLKKSNSLSVKDAVSLAINGSIFVSNGSKDIMVFNNGLGQTQSIQNAPSAFSGVLQLQMNSKGTVLYALSKDRKTVVKLLLLDNGSVSFDSQFAISGNELIDSFLINNQILYLQVGNKVVRTDIK